MLPLRKLGLTGFAWVVEIATPPYEVTETGWGEFEIPITIHFRDASAKPLTFNHLLKLYPPGNQTQSVTKVSLVLPCSLPAKLSPIPAACLHKQPVVSEFYDEALFTAPPPAFAAILEKRVPSHVAGPHPSAAHWKSFDDTEDLNAIKAARAFVAREIEGEDSVPMSCFCCCCGC